MQTRKSANFVQQNNGLWQSTTLGALSRQQKGLKVESKSTNGTKIVENKQEEEKISKIGTEPSNKESLLLKGGKSKGGSKNEIKS